MAFGRYMDQIFIQHRFTKSEGNVTLSDALVLPKSEYDALTPEQIEALKEQRFVNHKERIENPPQVPELTKAELIASLDKDLASLEEQKTLLTSQKAELQKGK